MMSARPWVSASACLPARRYADNMTNRSSEAGLKPYVHQPRVNVGSCGGWDCPRLGLCTCCDASMVEALKNSVPAGKIECKQALAHVGPCFIWDWLHLVICVGRLSFLTDQLGRPPACLIC